MLDVSFLFNLIAGIAGDKLVGEASRIVVAEACIQLLDIGFAEGEIYEINSVKVIFKVLVDVFISIVKKPAGMIFLFSILAKALSSITQPLRCLLVGKNLPQPTEST